MKSVPYFNAAIKKRLLHITIIIIIFSCCNKVNKQLTIHYTNQHFTHADSISFISYSQSIRYLDSVYASFPEISIKDKCHYYLFLIRLGDNQHNRQANNNISILYIDSLISIIEDNDLKKQLATEYVQAFQLKGEYYMFQQQYDKAFNAVSMCRFLSSQGGDSCTVGENTATMGLVAYRQGKYIKAAGYLKDAIPRFRYCTDSMKKFYLMQGHLDNIGVSYAKAGVVDSALKYYKIAENYIISNKMLYKRNPAFPYIALNVVYGNMADVFSQKKDFKRAEKYLIKTIDINSEFVHDSLESAQTQIQLAQLYIAEGEIKKALIQVLKAKSTLPALETRYRLRWYEVMKKVASYKKEPGKELYYFKQYSLLKDSLYEKDKLMPDTDPAAEYERIENAYQVNLLKEKNKRNNLYILTVATTGSLTIIIAVIIFLSLGKTRRLVKSMEKLNAELTEREKQLKKLIIENEMQERLKREEALFFQEVRLQMKHNEEIIKQRKKISVDLHDDLSGSLAALKFYIEDIAANTPSIETKQQLQKINREVKSIYESARHYMHSLWENIDVSHYDLLRFFKEISKKFSTKSSLKILSDIDIVKINDCLNMHQQDQLYHVINECISNTIKHAEASQIKIKISFDKNLCYFSFSDNGKGFKVNKTVRAGLGLKSMENRMSELKGTLKILSGFNGTRISSSFPLITDNQIFFTEKI